MRAIMKKGLHIGKPLIILVRSAEFETTAPWTAGDMGTLMLFQISQF